MSSGFVVSATKTKDGKSSVEPCASLTFRVRTWSEILQLTLIRTDEDETELEKSYLFIYAKLAILFEYDYSAEIENFDKDIKDTSN